MGAAPFWKVYSRDGVYLASFVDAADAACFIAALGTGATLRAGHRHIVWREGAETQPAGESYDHVATVADERFRNGGRTARGRK